MWDLKMELSGCRSQQAHFLGYFEKRCFKMVILKERWFTWFTDVGLLEKEL
jgi:hypothetical protein